MQIALHQNNETFVRFLLDNGADVNAASDENRLFALQIAVSSGRENIVRLLLDNGADVNIRVELYEVIDVPY